MAEELSWAAAVLAAGQGTRMKSELPKVLHELAGRPLVDHVLDLALASATPSSVVVVVGHGGTAVAERVAGRGARWVLQEPQLGTGDALRVALDELHDPEPDAVLVLSGDVPLLESGSLRRLMAELEGGADAALLTAVLDDPGSYGRVVRDGRDALRAVVEAGDADPRTLEIREVNAGVYGFRYPPVRAALAELAPDNEQRELYLTDVAEIFVRHGRRVAAVVLEDSDEMQGVNTRRDLARVARIFNRRLLDRLMDDGVTVQDPDSVWVEADCSVGRDAVLEVGVVLRGASEVGAGARIGAHSVLDGARVAAGETIPPLSVVIGH
jgi:bifunctional UDP-N-acetylglucosamine pyrophosphorylase/glucosamine-1-phosphate N-acetyltransferase